MISKELLSEIMNDEIKSIRIMNDTIFIYFENNNNQEYFISIYEIIHKCKQWAINKDYELYLALEDDKAGCELNHFRRGNAEFFAKTEADVIFKTCQFILEKENKI